MFDAIIARLTNIMTRLLAWLFRLFDDAGAWIEAGLILGFLIPVATIIVGIIFSRFGMFATARAIMFGGILFGIPFAIIVLGGASAIADVLVNGLWNKVPPGRAVRILQAYFSILIWIITIEEVMAIIGIYAPWMALVIGGVSGLVLAIISFFWDYGAGWGRRIVFVFQVVAVSWAITASLPSGFSITIFGIDLRHRIQMVEARAFDQTMIDLVWSEVADRERVVVRQELSQILDDIRRARTPNDLETARNRLAAWEHKYGERGFVPAVANEVRKRY